MLRNNKILNEKGTALLVSLIMLLLLTLIGFAAVTTSNIEVQISGNQRVANTAFYAFEAGIECIRNELNHSASPEALANCSSATTKPYYGVFGGISAWPQKGVANRGDNWGDPAYNNLKVIVPGRDPDYTTMYVFLVEGTEGFASRRAEVGIVLPQTDAGGPPNPSGTTTPGGSS
jgi:hypothetical protein